MDWMINHWEWATGILVTIIVGFWTLRKWRIRVHASKRVEVAGGKGSTANVTVSKSEDVKINVR